MDHRVRFRQDHCTERKLTIECDSAFLLFERTRREPSQQEKTEVALAVRGDAIAARLEPRAFEYERLFK